MTKHECAIVMAYTGITMLQGDDFVDVFQKYVEDKLGRPVWTHELCRDYIVKDIKEKVEPDFIRLCEEAT